MRTIIPVILAGGSGSRLWPVSRKSNPKQFAKLIGEHSLFQQCAYRLLGKSDNIDFENALIVTNEDYRFMVKQQLADIGLDIGSIITEPEGRNSAPAILAACLSVIKDSPDAVLLVCPSDHLISDKSLFHNAVREGLLALDDGRIVTFGVTPTRAETGYGYLSIGKKYKNNTFIVNAFIEKPSLEKATNMLQSEGFLWNSGIFLFRAKDLIAEFQRYSIESLGLVQKALEFAELDIGFLRLEAEYWLKLQSISIDYAVMEKSKKLIAVPLDCEWSDLGSWSSIWNEVDRDEKDVAKNENALSIDCESVLLWSESNNQQVVGLGLKDLVVVSTSDAILVADKNRTEEVKTIVEIMKSEDIKQAEIFPKDYRPWGWFESLVTSSRFQVKRLLVNPGSSLSLQSHHHRSEHWVVVHGTAEVYVDGKLEILGEGQSAYIPLGSKHRLKNPGKLPMILIEVQTGSYLGEDDIIRYEDAYNRK